jgi:hypothetical protein
MCTNNKTVVPLKVPDLTLPMTWLLARLENRVSGSENTMSGKGRDKLLNVNIHTVPILKFVLHHDLRTFH